MINDVMIFAPSDDIGSLEEDLAERWDDNTRFHRFTDFRPMAEEIDNNPQIVTLLAVLQDDLRPNLTKIIFVHEEYPLIPIVLVLPRGHTIDCAHLVKVGAVEMVYDDADFSELEAALARSQDLGVSRRPRQQDLLPTPPSQSKLISVVSPVGGAGRTFLATNAAAWLQQQDQGQVCLVDLGGPYGGATTTLRAQPVFTLHQAAKAARNIEQLNDHLDEYLFNHPLGFTILGAGNDPERWYEIRPEDLITLIGELQRRHDIVILDQSSGLDEHVLATLKMATSVAVVSRLDVASIRALRLFLEQLETREIHDDLIRVVLNQALPGNGLDASHVMDYLGRYECRRIASDDGVPRSMNDGSPIVVSKPKHPVSRSLATTIAALGSSHPSSPDEPPSVDGLSGIARQIKARLGLEKVGG